MKKNIDKLTNEINDYLAKFKDEDGNKPDPIHVAFIVQEYCEQFISYRNR